MVKLVGLKFILEYGAFVQGVVEQDEAQRIIKRWEEGWYKLKDVKTVGGVSPTGCGTVWSVRADAIIAIHTLPIEQPRAGSLPGITTLPSSGL